MDDKEIVLPQLKQVSLNVLPNFNNFCSTNYQLSSKLDYLSMEGCQDRACAGILTSLRDVKDLYIMDCEIRGLQGLYKGHKNVLRLQNLTTIRIAQCHKLSHVFSSTLVQNLLQLKEFRIEGCKKLEQIIAKDDEEEHLQSQEVPRYKDGVDEDREIIMFPHLQMLSLQTLPSFISFYPEGYHFILKLETLFIGGFHDDGDRVWAGIFSYLRDVRKLYIYDCGVKELKGLWKGATHIISLQNLTVLNFRKCSQLRHIFSATLSQSLLQLRELEVYDCGELEQIIVEDAEEDHLQPLLFPNLSKIDVRRCNKIKRVFSIIIAKGLQQLRFINVENNSQLEEVFGHRDGAEVMDDKAIVLPQLQSLFLNQLQSLTNFCPVGHHFIFPSLKNGGLVVEGCGKTATRFSMDENESVHAEAKLPKEGSRDYEEATTHIRCYDYGQVWARLPPYVET